ncbi:F-box only protein 3 [Coccomyxa sp. Obi]|nr:F-box only protein 3 [Coccomyxa sp. Obi]
MASFDDLSEPLLVKIFSLLGPKDCFMASCVQRSWKATAGNDSLWRERCEKLWSVTERKDHQRTDMPSFMATYYCWDKEVGKYGALARRAHLAWHKIEQFCQQHHPAMLCTLRPGASEEDLDEVEKTIDLPFPEAFRLLYRFHDGQILDGTKSLLHGLFGWFGVYDALHCTAMLPITIVAKAYVAYGDKALAFFGGDTISTRSTPTESWGISLHARNICVDVKTGSVHVMSYRRMQPAVHKPGGGGIMEWFEAYADALDSGYFKLASKQARHGHGIAGISLIPRRPPGQVSMVTRGVRVSASVIFLPDDPLMAGGRYNFAYSISFELLSEDEQRAAWPPHAGPFRPLASVQLRSRHWVIRNAAGQVEHVVNGEAVIGEYPHLTFGEPSFEYQSCTHQQEPEGFMEGHFRFVEGSLAQPTGPEFDVQCPKFRLCMPDYIF